MLWILYMLMRTRHSLCLSANVPIMWILRGWFLLLPWCSYITYIFPSPGSYVLNVLGHALVCVCLCFGMHVYLWWVHVNACTQVNVYPSFCPSIWLSAYLCMNVVYFLWSRTSSFVVVFNRNPQCLRHPLHLLWCERPSWETCCNVSSQTFQLSIRITKPSDYFLW